LADEVITKRDYQWYQLETVDDAAEYCAQYLKEHPEGSCEENKQIQLEYYPNDPMYVFGVQENLDIINVRPAWNITRGENQIVAIVDSGIAYDHEDLSENIAINTSENIFGCPGDDTYGCRFDNDSRNGINNSVYDDFGHGTHVAGIVASVGNNDTGITGISPKSKLLAIKVYSNGFATYYDMALAIQYAVQRGASVINMSLSGSMYSSYLNEMIEYARDNNVMIVAAAGNSKLNLDLPNNNSYPCEHNLENVICVGATNNDDSISDFSNFGSNVHVYAPGMNVISTIFTRSYVPMSGTSMSTPEVAATIALLKSMFPFAASEIKNRLMSRSDFVNGLKRLNVASVVLESDSVRQKALKYATIKVKYKNKRSLLIANLYRTFDKVPMPRHQIKLMCNERLVKKHNTNKNGIYKVRNPRRSNCRFFSSFVKYGLTKVIRSDIIKR